jgi:hypothetical protein
VAKELAGRRDHEKGIVDCGRAARLREPAGLPPVRYPDHHDRRSGHEEPGLRRDCGGERYAFVRDRVLTDLAQRRVTVTYDSLNMSLKNIEACIADSGFTANTIPARPDAAAKLPPECR